MLESMATGAAPILPGMGPGLVLRVLSKRPQRVRPGLTGTLESTFTLPAVDDAHVARYSSALGFAPGPVPLTWWYLPVQRAHMATMLSSAFPFRLAGIVHVENELISHARAPRGAPITLATRIEILPPTASGAVYCALETLGSAQGEPIFTCTSKYLAVRGRKSSKSSKPRAARTAPAEPGAFIESWTVTPSCGRSYARVSGDWNPIHLGYLSARLMGLPAPIIHGMHSVGKTCAALEAAAGRQLARLSVRFTAPIVLGSTAVLTTGSAPDRYALFCEKVLAAEGVYTLA